MIRSQTVCIVASIAIWAQLVLSHNLLPPFKTKEELGTCLSGEQFEKYGRDNHLGARAWHDQPIDQIRPLWPPV